MKNVKSKNNIIKLLLSIFLTLAVVLMLGSSVQAAPAQFEAGSMDLDGGTGVPADSTLYNLGDFWCSFHTVPIARRLNGTVIAYRNKIKGDYYNQELTYNNISTSKIEQSIAAGYYVYITGNGTKPEMQRVIWSSRQWKGKKGYVENLQGYVDTHTGNVMPNSKVIARADDWANFYYNLLQESGNNKVNIDVKPKSEEEIKVCVNQPDRIFIQGPYEINITNSSGSVMNNVATQYSKSPDIGTLVYNEIVGNNLGEDVFQFCKISSAVATIKYTDGTTSTQNVSTPSTSGSVKLLDASGNTIAFPEFGTKFYVSVPVSTGDTKTVENIELDFKLRYMTEIVGNTFQYQASKAEYEIANEKLKEWANSTVKIGEDSNTVTWELNETVKTAKDSTSNVTDGDGLKGYLINKIYHSAEEEIEVLSVGKNGRFSGTLWYNDGPAKEGETDIRRNFALSLKKMKETIEGEYKKQVGTTSKDFGHNVETGEVDEEGNPITKWEEDIRWAYTFAGRNEDKAIKAEDYSYDYSDEGSAKTAGEAAAVKLADAWYDKIIEDQSLCVWRYSWAEQNPIMTENTINKGTEEQPALITELTSVTPDPILNVNGMAQYSLTDETSFHLIGRDCTTDIGGKVWQEVKQTKDAIINGMLDSEDKMYGGMLVDLHLGDRNGPIVASTTTDSEGRYHFAKLNALEKYTVVFTYNGQYFEQTYYKNDLSGDGGYSNAREIDRAGFNDRFDTIDSSPNNYNLNNEWRISYGKNSKLKDTAGNYIDNGTDKDGNTQALMYIDAWNKFIEFSINDKSYTQAYVDLENWLNSRGVGETDRKGVVQFMKDSMTSANTIQYPVYNYFLIEDKDNPKEQSYTEHHAGREWEALYTNRSDQSRNVDFGINERDSADLALQKDVYKATVRVNGKTHEYMYNKKDANVDDDGNWNLNVRQSDYLYNGDYKYNREIRKSEYLYDGSISTASDQNANAKDLQVFVTYRIVVRNQSQTYATTVNEIVDYFDESEYTFDGSLNGNNYTPHVYKEYDSNGNVTREYITSYVGDRNGNKIGDLTITNSSTLGNGRGDVSLGNNYKPIYVSGITKTDGDNRLSTGEMAYIYLTFKVKTHTDENGMSDRVQLDVDTSTGELKGVGKRNIAEINGYSTYYKQGIKVPDTLNSDNTRNDKDVSGQKAGSIDIDSSAGSLRNQDLRENGDIIIEKDPKNPNRENPVTTRAEDDSDKAPNIRLVFPENDNQERVITGYVYEDERNTASDKAVIGNGVYDDGETKINGVTTQLVELVQAVDADGIPTGGYLGEYVWNAKTWDGSKWVDSNSSNTSGNLRYYSGQKEVLSPIICGPGATKIEGYTVTEDGKYAFKSVPAGDLFIRFIYGDTTQTTLTKVDGEGSDVTSLLNGSTVDNTEGYISNSGLNAKSYNGQDYKSTAYQRNLSNGTEVNQSAGTYNGINGYLNYDTQNYSILGQGRYEPNTVNTIDGKDKNVMYYYNIGESQIYSGISDAKDVNNIRENVNNYSRGITNIDGVSHQTLTNRRGEVLASGLKVSSAKQAEEQITMLKELMNNTAMISQTGVINAEIEYNAKKTNNQGDKNVIGYVIDDVDLGLEERPVAQLKVNKEVSNFKLTLANGSVMFDTGKAVTNLSFAEHGGHLEYYNRYGTNNYAYRLAQCVIGNNTAAVPELITTYMDEELMYGARLELTYDFTVTNIGDVDYLDKQFYYIGKTINTDESNISKTRADKVIDYVSNNVQFVPTNSSNSAWSIRTVQELTARGNTDANGKSENAGEKQDLVNAKHKETMDTYNNIVTTGEMSPELLPEVADKGAESAGTQMLVSTTLVPDTGDDSMVYNNMAEIVQTSNTQGRRMKYSISGNQKMADQSLSVGEPVIEGEQYTKADLVTPAEIDADSSQKVLILPPTGSDKNYTLWVTVGIVAAALIGVSVILIKRFLNRNK